MLFCNPMKEISASIIAKETGGLLVGTDVSIWKVSKLEEGSEGSLGFFANPKYEKALYETNCSLVFIPSNFTPSQSLNCQVIQHANPYYAFCMILAKYFDPNERKTGISSSSVIHETAKIGTNVYIGNFVTIDADVEIGDNCHIESGCFIGKNSILDNNVKLHANVSLYSGTVLGKNCIIHSGTVIGSDGFGFAPVNGTYMKIPQVGTVTIEDDVEIGSNCSIDRATMGQTLIKRGTKLDNLIQIAHNVELGSDIVIAAQTGIAGSTKVGDHSMLGGQVGVTGHITIAPFTSVGAQGGVTQSIKEPNQKLAGTPVTDVNSYLRGIIGSRKVADLMKEIQTLKKEIELLKNK